MKLKLLMATLLISTNINSIFASSAEIPAEATTENGKTTPPQPCPGEEQTTPQQLTKVANSISPQEQEAREKALAASKRKGHFTDVPMGQRIWQRPNGTQYFLDDETSKVLEFTFNEASGKYEKPTELTYNQKIASWEIQEPEITPTQAPTETNTTEEPDLVTKKTTEPVVTPPPVTQTADTTSPKKTIENPAATETQTTGNEEKPKIPDTNKNEEASTKSTAENILSYKGSMITATTLSVILRQAWVTFCATRTNTSETKAEKAKLFAQQTINLIKQAIRHPLISIQEQKALTIAVWTLLLGNSACLIANNI